MLRLKAKQAYLKKATATESQVNERLLKEDQERLSSTTTSGGVTTTTATTSAPSGGEDAARKATLDDIERRLRNKEISDILKGSNNNKYNNNKNSTPANLIGGKRDRDEGGAEGGGGGGEQQSAEDLLMSLMDDGAGFGNPTTATSAPTNNNSDTITNSNEVDEGSAEYASLSPLQRVRRSLPIYKMRDHIISTIRDNQVVVVEGETGSGKTTQLLQYLYEAGFSDPLPTEATSAATETAAPDVPTVAMKAPRRRLVCTQPRRLAATSVAERVAKEMGCVLGGRVGYKVRFDDRTSQDTEVVFMTDGMLLKEICVDPSLESVAVIMIDEAHERSVATDVLLGLLKGLLPSKTRSELRIVLASATIQVDLFCNFFAQQPTAATNTVAASSSSTAEDGGDTFTGSSLVSVAESKRQSAKPAPLLRIKGRTFPVESFFSEEPVADFVTAAAETALQIHLDKPLPGDILIFLPGQHEIEKCGSIIREILEEIGDGARDVVITPVYASLHPSQQKRIHEPTPAGSRKIVIATNIAETSLTVDGIVYVIDCGLVKQNYYNQYTMVEELTQVAISQASAGQRAGRAGRTQPGECMRLYTNFMYQNDLPKQTTPEILRSNLSSVILNLFTVGVEDLLSFDATPKSAITLAVQELLELGAIQPKEGGGSGAEVTELGIRMSEFPLDPKLSKCLAVSDRYRVATEMAIVAAVITTDVGGGGLFASAIKGGRAAAMASGVPPNSPLLSLTEEEQKRAIATAKERLYSFPGQTYQTRSDIFGYVMVFKAWLANGCKDDWAAQNFLNHRALLRCRDVFNQLLKIFDRIGIKRSGAADVGDDNNHAAKKDSEVGGEEEEEHLRQEGGVLTLPQLNTALNNCLLEGYYLRHLAKLDPLDRKSYTLLAPTVNAGKTVHSATSILGDLYPGSYVCPSFEDRKNETRRIMGRAPLPGAPSDSSAIAAAATPAPVVLFMQMRNTGGERPFLCHNIGLTDPMQILAFEATMNCKPQGSGKAEVGRFVVPSHSQESILDAFGVKESSL